MAVYHCCSVAPECRSYLYYLDCNKSILKSFLKMDEQNQTKFLDHEVVQKILTDLSEAYKSQKINPKKFIYCRAVQHEVSKVFHTLKTLQTARVLIAEEHPNVTQREGSSIASDTFVRYNIECYFLRLTTYKDQVMQLIDAILELGIEKGLGYEKRLLKKSEKLQLSEAADVLEGIKKLLLKVQPIRNKLAHEGVYEDTDLLLIEIAKFAREKFDMQALTKEEEDLFTRLKIMEMLKEMMQIEEDLTSNFYRSLRALFKKYKDRMVELTLP